MIATVIAILPEGLAQQLSGGKIFRQRFVNADETDRWLI
jgi:hypothetical protein